MKTIEIKGTKRGEVGTKDAVALRRQNMIPCVIYGGKEPIHFSAPELDFRGLVYSPNLHAVKIDVGGTQYSAIMKDIQFHKVSDRIQHIDFLEIAPGKSITVELPIKTEGTAAGVREGGKLLKKMRTLKAKGAIEKMPEAVTVDVAPLKIGDSIRVKDIKIDGIEFLNIPTATVVGVRITRNVVEETPAAAAAAAKPAAAAAPAAADAKKEAPKK